MSRHKQRRRRPFVGLLLFVLTLLIIVGQQRSWFSTATQKVESAQPGLYAIDHFIDGDTIAVDMNGTVEEVRFIGVDTPETHKPHTPVQCYGPNAAAFTKSQIGSGRVRLASDPYSTNRDRYDRLLRYVYLPDGRLLNEELVQQGYGFYYPYFPYTKSAQFRQDEMQAQAAKRGLWSACTPTPSDDGGYKMNETEPASLEPKA